MTVIRVFTLPDLGEGLTESEIVAWHVAPGDTVTLNQHIADVETAKAVVELPSPFTGVVSELHRPAGVLIRVGDPILSVEVADRPLGSTETMADAGAGPAPREANLVGYGPEAEREGRPRRRARRAGAAAPDLAVGPAAAEPVSATERPRSSPPVRMLARDLGVDLERVTGTGRDGVITRADVRNIRADLRNTGCPPAAAAPPAAPGAAPGAAGVRESRAPIRSLRKLTAAATVQSAFTAPHVTEFLTLDVTPTVDLLDTINHAVNPTGGAGAVKIGFLAIVAQALCLAVARTPSVNTRWDEAAGEIIQYHYVNLGIAAATPRGLLVPVITDADRRGLAGLAAALHDLTAAARSGTTAPAALAGGTITITNIGVFGIDAGTPLLNPGEAAILAVGAIRRRPWEFQGEIALRQVLTLSLSFDHRLVDGEQGSRFLTDVGTILTNPGLALLMTGGPPGAA